MQTAEQFSSADAAKFFDRFAEQFDTLYDGRRGAVMRWMDKQFRSDMFVRFALTFEAFGDISGKSVVDIGCGSGPYIVEAFRRGAGQVTGVDPADGMLALAERKLTALNQPKSSYKLVKGTFPGVELEQHDHAIVMGVMDYVDNAGEFLLALRKLVRVSAAVSFPSRHWLRTPLRQARYRLRHCPLYFYDERWIRELGKAAGFSDVRIQKIPGAGLDYHACFRP